jgi:hypothetical protein
MGDAIDTKAQAIFFAMKLFYSMSFFVELLSHRNQEKWRVAILEMIPE